MPFKSEAQRAYLYATHPKMAHVWEEETSKRRKLPKRVKRKRFVHNIRRRRTVGRTDPSRTALIRRSLYRALHERLARIQKAVWHFVVRTDSLGLNPHEVTTVADLIGNAPFKFETTEKKLRAFNRWLKQQIDDGVLEADPQTGEPKGKPWLHKYIDSAYRKGLVRAYIDTKGPSLAKQSVFYEGSKAQFLQTAFAAPERVSKLELIYTRTYEDLKGITQTMASKMSRVLATGLANGNGAYKVGRELARIVPKLSKSRAQTIAMTEIIHAHAEGQLDGMEDLGVTGVGAEVEFATAGDDGVCPLCASMEGTVYTIEEARGVIPVHPRCRCAWLPLVQETR